MSVEHDAPPERDEGEIVVFGPGVGECAMVHLGNWRWLVVDSCKLRGEPVALDYLRRIGLGAEAITEVLVTHWHDDHIRGVAGLLQAAPAARFTCSAALNRKEFRELLKGYVKGETGVSEMWRAFRHCNLRKQSGVFVGPHWAQEGSVLVEDDFARVRVLSPSHYTVTLAHLELGRQVPEIGPRLRPVSQGPNELAVVLHVEVGGKTLLLGADLECSRDDSKGWSGVISSSTRPKTRARLFKVPHHGSDGADDPRAWSELLEASPVTVVTPYNALRVPIPTPAAQETIRQRSESAFLSAPAQGRRARRDPSVERQIRQMTKGLRELTRPMGRVRIRWRAGEPERVDLSGSASRIEPAA